ncbi:mitogen-activated protein kinase kinase kinase 4-like [Crassostrea virginica]
MIVLQSLEVYGSVQLSSSPSLDLHYAESSSTSVNNFHRSSSLTDFGAWCEQFIQMGLLSFQSSYLFLIHVFLEVIHEALRLHLEQRPVIDPSFPRIRLAYFTYLQSWILALQSLPEASLSLKNMLESEWLFTKQICPHVIGGEAEAVIGGEAEAGKRFSEKYDKNDSDGFGTS